MIREERTEFLRTARQREEHIRHKAGFLLHRLDPLPDIAWQIIQ